MNGPAVTAEADRPPHIASLQAMRAIAAVLVLVYHAGGAATRHGGPMPGSGVTTLGAAGVDLFFVLSGFVICHVAVGPALDGTGGDWRAFALARIRRIYLPYWPLGLAMAVYIFCITAPDAGGLRNWLASLFLLPVGEPALNVAWTLQHEIIFYAIISIGLLTGWWRIGLALWIVAIVGCWLTRTPAPIGLQLIDAEFLFGIAAWAAWRNGGWHTMAATSGALVMFAAALIFIGADGSPTRSGMIATAAIFAALLPWIAQAEQRGQIRVPRALSFLGDASYAIYLIHAVPLLALASVVAGSGWATAFFVIGLSGLMVGIAYHLMIERPLLAWAGKRSR